MDRASSIQLICDDDYVLDGLIFSPPSKAEAFVIFQGGTAIRKEFYSNFCAYLAEQGFYVLSYDYRGIGKSRSRPLRGMKATLLDWGRLDMQAAIRFADNHSPHLKKILVGHSIGAQLIGFAENNHLLAGVLGIGSSTGTWWKMKSPRNLSAAFLWYVFNPILTTLAGYAPLKMFGIMEDLPKGVINQWSLWCRSPFYFGSHFGKSLSEDEFHPLKVPFIVHYFSDDYIATNKTVTDLLALYRGTKTKMLKHYPKWYNVKKVGHFGVFSRKYRDSFWRRMAEGVRAFID